METRSVPPTTLLGPGRHSGSRSPQQQTPGCVGVRWRRLGDPSRPIPLPVILLHEPCSQWDPGASGRQAWISRLRMMWVCLELHPVCLNCCVFTQMSSPLDIMLKFIPTHQNVDALVKKFDATLPGSASSLQPVPTELHRHEGHIVSSVRQPQTQQFKVGPQRMRHALRPGIKSMSLMAEVRMLHSLSCSGLCQAENETDGTTRSPLSCLGFGRACMNDVSTRVAYQCIHTGYDAPSVAQAHTSSKRCFLVSSLETGDNARPFAFLVWIGMQGTNTPTPGQDTCQCSHAGHDAPSVAGASHVADRFPRGAG